MNAVRSARVAIVGAGIAGVTCARWLADAGHTVQLFDKSRGTGGRMATRRAEWTSAEGVVHTASFDHGAPGFTARSTEFVRFVEQAHRDGLLSRWAPVIAPRSYVPLGGSALWVPVPDLPSLCRALLASLPAEVQAVLQQALAEWLGHSLTWHHAAVHHWRYAPARRADASASAVAPGRCWWAASLGLGVCGDALGGGGVEGAWTSGRALAAALIERHRASPAGSGPPASRTR